MPFPFEKLTVYQRALDLAESIELLKTELKGKASFSIRDQLSRAALSIPLNIAEGHGRWDKRQVSQFLRIAKGSAFECIPILQIAYRTGLLDEPTYERFYSKIEEIVKMIAAWIRTLDKKGHGFRY